MLGSYYRGSYDRTKLTSTSGPHGPCTMAPQVSLLMHHTYITLPNDSAAGNAGCRWRSAEPCSLPSINNTVPLQLILLVSCKWLVVRKSPSIPGQPSR